MPPVGPLRSEVHFLSSAFASSGLFSAEQN